MLVQNCCEGAASWKPPRGDLDGELVVAIVEEAEADAPVGARAGDGRRSAGDEFPPRREDNDISFDAERTIENKQAVLEKIGGRVGIRFENPNAGLATLRHGAGQSDLEEKIVVGRAGTNFAGGLGVLAGHGFKFQVLARAALDNALFCGRGTGADGIEKEFGAFARYCDVVSYSETVGFGGQKLVQSEIVGRKCRGAREKDEC